MSPEDLPEAVRARAAAVGATGWIDALPALVAGLERDWSIRTGATLSGGTEACVVEATLADGGAAVLKLLVPDDPAAVRNEIETLRAVAGEGCARLLRGDVERGALLLERLGRPLVDLGLPVARRHEILCAAARRVWRRAPGLGLPTGAEKGRWLLGFIEQAWEELERPCTERAVAYALACARRRTDAHDDERARLVHGDVHQWNALEADDGFKLIDPDGLLAEPEYDLGIVMREDPVELLEGDPRERAHRLAALTGTNATAIWEWGAVERVSTGLMAVRIELQPEAAQMLAAADAVARTGW